MMGNDTLTPWQCNANNADSSTATESLTTYKPNLVQNIHTPYTYGYKQ